MALKKKDREELAHRESNGRQVPVTSSPSPKVAHVNTLEERTSRHLSVVLLTVFIN